MTAAGRGGFGGVEGFRVAPRERVVAARDVEGGYGLCGQEDFVGGFLEEGSCGRHCCRRTLDCGLKGFVGRGVVGWVGVWLE